MVSPPSADPGAEASGPLRGEGDAHLDWEVGAQLGLEEEPVHGAKTTASSTSVTGLVPRHTLWHQR